MSTLPSRFFFLPLIFAFHSVLAGCGGGGAAVSTRAVASASAGGEASVSLSISVPSSTQAHARRPSYVSAATQSAVVQYQGSSTVLPCSTTCDGSFTVVPGSVTFVINLYDGAGGTGNVLSTGSTTATITRGALNPVGVSMGGVIASLALSLGMTSAPSGTAASIPVTVTARDAAGKTIIGSDSYASPIALSSDDKSGATVLSAASITSPSSAVSLNYNGGSQAKSVNITASVANDAVAPQTATLGIGSDHPFYYGAFARGGQQPFGMMTTDSAPWTISPTKSKNLLDLGITIARASYENFFIDLTYLYGPGHYDAAQWSRDDTVISWLLANNVVPYIDLADYPVQNATQLTQRYNTAADFGTWCSTAAQHVKATFPQIGTSVPAFFGTPENEENNATPVWTAAQSAPYMKACYSAIHAVFPKATVYGGEFAVGIPPPNDMLTYTTALYANGCRIGTCFDAFSMHLSPLDTAPGQLPTLGNNLKPCFQNGRGWTFQCVSDLQAISTANGDPVPHVMFTETGVNSVPDLYQQFTAAGQATWLTDSFAMARANPTIDGMFWMNIDEDQTFVGTAFHDTALVDPNGVRRPAFAAYQAFTKSLSSSARVRSR